MLFYHLLVALPNQTCTHNADGDKSNLLLGNFGHVGEMNFFRAFTFDKNAIQENETSKLVPWFAEGRLWQEKRVNGKSCENRT